MVAKKEIGPHELYGELICSPFGGLSMNHSLSNRYPNGIVKFLAAVCLLFLVAMVYVQVCAAQQPKVGGKAIPFTLNALDGGKVSLNNLTRQGPLVLVILRGYPGYQCPICTAQVASLMASSDQFAKSKAQVVLVYPGPAEGLKQHADEFVQGKTIPKNFRLVLDPDYKLINKYGLRWLAPNETSYPSTFVIDRAGTVLFSKISKSHGDRATPEEILKALGQ